MQSNKKYIELRFFILIITFLSFSLSLQARQKVLDYPTFKSMNNYILFINQHIRSLEVLHTKFEQFNINLNEYRKNYPRDKAGRVAKEETQGGLLFETPKSQGSFNSLYEKTMQDSHFIPKEYRLSLNQKTETLMRIVVDLVKHNKQLEAYVNNKSYLEEPKLSTAYEALKQSSELFNRFASLKQDLYESISSLHKTYQVAKPNDPYLNYETHLASITTYANGILIGLKANSLGSVDRYHKQLKFAIDQAKNNKKEILLNIKKEDHSQWKVASENFQRVITIGEELLAVTKPYLSQKALSKGHVFGKSHYYFTQVSAKFNHATGMVAAYNQFVELGRNPMLYRMEESPWLKVIDINYQDTVNSEPMSSEPLTSTTTKSLLEGFAPNNMVFLLDVSGSMKQEDKLPLLKSSMKYLIDLMRPEDKIAIVTYSGKAKVALFSTTAADKKKIYKALNNLKSEGGSNAFQGMMLAYEVLSNNFISNGNNRIILATDGGFNLGEHFMKTIKNHAVDNKHLSVFYFGDSEVRFKPQLERLSKNGKGNYAHIKPENAEKSLLNEAKAVHKDNKKQ